MIGRLVVVLVRAWHGFMIHSITLSEVKLGTSVAARGIPCKLRLLG